MSLHERLLRLTLDPHKASALLGDLEEEAVRVGATRAWIQRQAFRHALTAARAAAGRARRRMLTTTRIAFRDAWRSIVRFRLASAAAIAILAVSMAAAAVTFSVVDTIVLRPLPYPDSERLVALFGTTPKDRHTVVSPTDYFAWRESTSSFDGLAAWQQPWPIEVKTPQGTHEVPKVITTASLFDVLRAKPLLGETFTEEHETPEREGVGVISHQFWLQHLGGDPRVIGSQLQTSRGAITVLGVMPPTFTFPVEASPPVALWTPLATNPEDRVLSPERGRARYIEVLGRLKSGTTIAQARADVERVVGALSAEYPDLFDQWHPRTEFVLDALTERVGGWMRLVLGAVAALMAIASLNVANLLLTRSTRRIKDVSVREALGASRAQIVAMLLAESILLSSLAIWLGLLLAYWAIQGIKSALPPGIPRADQIALDARVVMACSVAGVVVAVVSGLVPAWQGSRTAVGQLTKEGATGTTAGPARRFWQRAFLVSQVALVSALIVAATLLVGSFIQVMSVDLGFSRHNLLGVRLLPLLPSNDGREMAIRDFYSRVDEVVQAVPGVQDTAYLAGASLPLSRQGGSTTARIPAAGSHVSADLRRVSGDYFDTLGIRIVEGRTFTPADANQHVLIIDTVAAERLFGNVSAIGQQITLPGTSTATVIGVVANVRLIGPEGAIQPQVYRPLRSDMGARVLIVRAAVAPEQLTPAIETAIASVMPRKSAPLTVISAEEEFQFLTADRRFNATLMSSLGLLALLIAATGVYATTAAMVAQRTKEIGIRMALGASATRVVRSVTWTTARLLLVGAFLGLVGAWTTSGLLSSVVFGIQPTDVIVYVVPAVLIVAGGVLAALLPARRAARIDPLIALRTE